MKQYKYIFNEMTLAEKKEQILMAEESVRQYGNKEILVLFLLMKETGIRLGDLVDLRQENLQGMELHVIDKKRSETELYQYEDGSFPCISSETVEMLTLGEDGKFFHHNKEYYLNVLKKVIPDKKFSCYSIRDYVLRQRRKLQQKSL